MLVVIDTFATQAARTAALAVAVSVVSEVSDFLFPLPLPFHSHIPAITDDSCIIVRKKGCDSVGMGMGDHLLH